MTELTDSSCLVFIDLILALLVLHTPETNHNFKLRLTLPCEECTLFLCQEVYLCTKETSSHERTNSAK